MNTDPDFNSSSEWMPATWGLSREGVDIFPEMTITDGIATTILNSHAGKDQWNSASYRQDKYQGSTAFQIASLTSESKVSYKVKPFYENPGKHACFNIFVEIWLNFTDPEMPKGRIAELMFKQRVITSPDIGNQPENSYTSTINPDAGFGDWYLITYRLPDVPFNQWTQHELSWNEYFYPKLEEFGVDLTKGHIYAIIFGIEGYSAYGGVGAQWDFVNCMTKPSSPISNVPEEIPTPTTSPTLTPTPSSTSLATLLPTPTLTPTPTPALTAISIPPLTATPKPTTAATPIQIQIQSPSPSISPTEAAPYQYSVQIESQMIPSNSPIQSVSIIVNRDLLGRTYLHIIVSAVALAIFLITITLVATIVLGKKRNRLTKKNISNACALHKRART